MDQSHKGHHMLVWRMLINNFILIPLSHANYIARMRERELSIAGCNQQNKRGEKNKKKKTAAD